jgi:hypothetical protein
MSTPTERFTTELERLAFEHYGSCTKCGRKIREAEHANYGYTAGDAPAYVCDDCVGSLSELAARRYFMERPYDVPPADAHLWRYMDFAKYVSLLSTRALYFCRADQFEDIYEGAKGPKRRKVSWDNHYLTFFRDAILHPPPGHSVDKSENEVEEEARRLLSQLEAGGRASRATTFISCWHESDHESAAMWRLYSRYLPNALAIRTSLRGLYHALGRNPHIQIGRVHYLDMNKEYAGVNEAFWRKRSSFQHEREVRAIATDFRSTEFGKMIKCDLAELIEQVFVSPEAPRWLFDVVNAVNEKFGVRVSVTESSLLEEPFF